LSVTVVQNAEETLTSARPADEVDAELLALPAPPRGKRLAAMTVMALTVAASGLLLASLAPDIGYFFASSQAGDLGEATGVSAATLEPNTYVRIRGTPMASGMVRYQRLFGGDYVVFPLAGQEQRTIYVQLPVSGPRAERELMRREYDGRLVRFGDLGSRFRSVRTHLDEKLGMPVSSDTFLLLADEPPGSYGWSLGLAFLCVLFIAVNVALLWRWFRPIAIRKRRDEDASANADSAPA
jgi:hypothetical protein